jgi:glycosyltransferase involved in cell wall biosynthesis
MKETELTVLHLIATNFFGGPEKQLLEHAVRMNGAVRIVSFLENGRANELLVKAEEAGICTESLITHNPFNPLVIISLLKVLKKHRPELLCAHGYKSNILGRIATWIIKTPCIAVSRGWTGESKKIKYYEKIDKLFLRFADHVVAVSEGQRQKILDRGVSREVVSVIHNSINSTSERGTPDKKSLREILGVRKDALLVISAGRLSPEKNYKSMIKAAKIVVSKNPEVIFAIFGEGAERKELQNLVDIEGLGRSFFLHGFIKNISSLFSQADIFILPSFTEGLSNVLLEACASRVPCIASAAGGNPEIIQDDETGFLVQNPEDVNSFAEKIQILLQDPELRKRMGENARNYVQNNFSFEEQTKKYYELYLKLLAK